MPEIPDAWLELDEERQRELRDSGWGMVELLWRFDLSLRADGSGVERLVIARQFLTAEGIQQGGTISVQARTQIERSYLERAFVRLPDGRTREFDLRRVQVLRDQQFNVFSDLYSIVFPFEGLVPGATVVVVMSRQRPAGAWPLPGRAFSTRGGSFRSSA